MNLKSSILFLPVCVLGGCFSPDFNPTPKPTPSLIQTSLSDLTDDTNTTTSELSRDLNFTYFDLRSGNTAEERRDSIQSLKSLSDLPAKLAYAARFVSAMEFQYWRPSVETLEERNRLEVLGLKELFNTAKELKDSQDLSALSGAIHFVSLEQKGSIRALPGTPETSLYSIVEAGLKANDQIECGRRDETNFPEPLIEVVRNKSLAVKILQLRQKFLRTFGLTLMLGPSSRDPLIHLKTWDPALIHYTAVVLEQSAATRALLVSLGHQATNEPSLDPILKLPDLSPLLENSLSEDRASALKRLNEALKRLSAAPPVSEGSGLDWIH